MIIGTSMLYPSPPDIATLCHVQVRGKFSEVPLRSQKWCTGFRCIATEMRIVVYNIMRNCFSIAKCFTLAWFFAGILFFFLFVFIYFYLVQGLCLRDMQRPM